MQVTRSKRRTSCKSRQLTFRFVHVAKPGNRMGRPPRRDSGVSHARRDEVRPEIPMHITIKLKRGLPTLRMSATHRVVKGAIADTNALGGARICEYSAQRDHVHMIVEADDKTVLAARMKGLKVRLARRLNKLWGRTGSVFADRYHRSDLESPRKVRNALVYVLHNDIRHTSTSRTGGVDEFSSGPWFEGWSDAPWEPAQAPAPTVRPKRWLLRTGWWRRHGRISLAERPAAARPKRKPTKVLVC
jgi:putative transposase